MACNVFRAIDVQSIMVAVLILVRLVMIKLFNVVVTRDLK